ncbi:hypothetical protein AB0L57_07300 [Nocardia sp. NPDC052254]|uniref:hypothetical protein n=1 Tax=Nocardia sp. NPDC052254 TaxID=3155681 RepID=UPI003446E106
MAPHTAHSRSAGQILQHTAIVLAGMASIGLTVAAGTYVVNQIGGSGLPAMIGPGEPDTVNPPAPEPQRSEAQAPTTARGTARWGLAAESRPLPIVAGPAAEPYPAPAVSDGTPVVPITAATTVRPGGVGGRLNLSEDTYLGANLARTQQNSLTVRLDTNLPAIFGTTEPPRTDQAGPSTGVTEFRTELDTHSGELGVAMTDPLLGRHDMQVQRHAQPEAVDSEHLQQLPDSTQA